MTGRDSNPRHDDMDEQVEHDRCDDDEDARSCPICRSDPLDPDFAEVIEPAAVQPGRAMTAGDFTAWLRAP